MHTWTVRAGTLACIALALAACSRKPQPQQPAPPPETSSASAPVQTNNDDAERRARAAEAARLREENARTKATLEQMVFFDDDTAYSRNRRAEFSVIAGLSVSDRPNSPR